MADGGKTVALRYSAFISYSHRDVAFARRLHRSLERYKLPRRLAQAAGGRVTASRRLRPVFRDRDELTAAADLSDAVQEALGRAAALIVVCSPQAAQSEWVGREVALFRQVHGDGAILAALIEGEMAEAAHPELCTGPGGRAIQPLAADFRREGDGPRLALLKLVAALAGVGLDELVQRDAQRRIRQVTQAGFAALAGMAAMAVLALVAIHARTAAEQARGRGEQLIGFMITDLRSRLKGVGRLDLLDAVNQGATRYYQSQDISTLSVSALEQRAALLQAMGEDDEKRGKFDEARAQFDEARRTTGALLAETPGDHKRILAHARSQFWEGFIAIRIGRPEEAEKAFTAYVMLASRLLAQSPGDPTWQIEAGDALSTRGSFILRHYEEFSNARTSYLAAIADYQAASKLPVEDPEALGDITECLSGLADIARLQGDYRAALAFRNRQLDILNRLQARDPRNADLVAQKVYNTLALARIESSQGHHEVALEKLSKGHQDAVALATSDPENGDFARQVRIFELFWAREWMKMSPREDIPRALISARLDCSIDSHTEHNDELITFCNILRLHWEVQSGEAKSVSDRFVTFRIPELLKQDRLTSRWGLDLAEEMQLSFPHNYIGLGK